MAVTNFSTQQKPPEDLKSSGTAKYKDLFRFILTEAKEGEYVKVDISGTSKEDLEREIHAVSASIRSWKDRFNSNDLGNSIEITQTKKILSDTQAELWIKIEKLIKLQV